MLPFFPLFVLVWLTVVVSSTSAVETSLAPGVHDETTAYLRGRRQLRIGGGRYCCLVVLECDGDEVEESCEEICERYCIRED